MQIRIYYEDTDAGGVVYHTNYLKYCERARSEYFFASNYKIMDENAHFLVKKLEAQFLKPAYLGDILEVKTFLIKMKNASVELKQDIFKDNIKIFSTNILLAFVKNGKLAKITAQNRELFEKLSLNSQIKNNNIEGKR